MAEQVFEKEKKFQLKRASKKLRTWHDNMKKDEIESGFTCRMFEYNIVELAKFRHIKVKQGQRLGPPRCKS